MHLQQVQQDGIKNQSLHFVSMSVIQSGKKPRAVSTLCPDGQPGLRQQQHPRTPSPSCMWRMMSAALMSLSWSDISIAWRGKSGWG